jgi:hypothetical protein
METIGQGKTLSAKVYNFNKSAKLSKWENHKQRRVSS